MSILQEMIEISEARLAKGRDGYLYWDRGSNGTRTYQYKGKELKIEKTDPSVLYSGYDGYIDDKKVLSTKGNTVGDIDRIAHQLIADVDAEDSPKTPEKDTVSGLITHMRNRFPSSKLNSWHWGELSPGNFGRHKTSALTAELTKRIRTSESNVKGTDVGQQHNFVVQAVFDKNGESAALDKITTWLSQGGQLITFGAPVFKFKHGDIKSFETALGKAVDQTDDDLIKTLYKSGYQQYGRA